MEESSKDEQHSETRGRLGPRPHSAVSEGADDDRLDSEASEGGWVSSLLTKVYKSHSHFPPPRPSPVCHPPICHTPHFP